MQKHIGQASVKSAKTGMTNANSGDGGERVKRPIPFQPRPKPAQPAQTPIRPRPITITPIPQPERRAA